MSKIDMLPDKATPIVQWAFDRIVDKRMTQDAIRSDMNHRLAALDLAPLSMSSFNRWAGRVMRGGEKRPVAVGVAAVPTTTVDSALDGMVMTMLAVAETLKTTAFHVLQLKQSLPRIGPEAERLKQLDAADQFAAEAQQRASDLLHGAERAEG